MRERRGLACRTWQGVEREWWGIRVYIYEGRKGGRRGPQRRKRGSNVSLSVVFFRTESSIDRFLMREQSKAVQIIKIKTAGGEFPLHRK